MSEDNILARYWKAYGGWKAALTSVYFWVAAFLTVLLYPQWVKAGWWGDTLSIMPSVLGFSLGGFAMWVAIGDEKFKSLISGSDDNASPSPFMEVNATFAHFILLQLVSIILAVIAKAYDFSVSEGHWLYFIWGESLGLVTSVFYCFSYFIFLYALLTAFAAVLALFRVSSWYDDMQSMNKNESEKNSE
ncbi:hypothetical protein P3521_03555 [Vibrio parahaemolyticus]|nr:hypothetical protein [Vibrio parahaemolyticus]MDF4668677.1 hypothetical protein [Vibrio parahaemolyticus]HAV1412773.1 hypothetical protein [Vibrio parahaemolyticus]HAV2004857.1 hypothetical protein [Vibrio parahaemolyticus]